MRRTLCQRFGFLSDVCPVEISSDMEVLRMSCHRHRLNEEFYGENAVGEGQNNFASFYFTWRRPCSLFSSCRSSLFELWLALAHVK